MSRTRIPEDTLFEVTALSADGFGLAQFQANEHAKLREVLIKGSLPGEKVTARIHKRRRGQFWAEAQEFVELSPERVAPPCAHFPRCGGCALQHMDYAQQLQHKQQLLLDELIRTGVGYQQLRAPVSGPRLHYRSKARLGVRKLGEDLLLGFRESFGSRVLRMEQCLTLTADLARLVEPLRNTLQELSIAHAIPQVELASGDSTPQVVVRHLEALNIGDLQQLKSLELATGATVLLQPGGPTTLHNLDGWQPGLLSYGLPEFGLDLCFGALDFTQVNLTLNQQLVACVVAELGPLAGTQVVDMFCGIGNFSLPLAQRGAQVLGIEGSESSVARAQANAQRNGLMHNSQFAAMDLYSKEAGQLFEPQAAAAQNLNWLMRSNDANPSNQNSVHKSSVNEDLAMLLDPPRSGAGPALSSWLAAPALAQLTQIAYVSCNPVSFADDAKVLLEAGFTLEQVGIFDMFPQTAHVETFGMFRRG